MQQTRWLRQLIDQRNQQIQKSRKAWRERMRAIEQGRDEADPDKYRVACDWHERYCAMEADIDQQIADIVEPLPIYEHASAVKGIGPSMVAQLVAFIDPAKAPYPSSLWRFAGVGLGKYWQDESGKVVAPKEGWRYVKEDNVPVRKKVKADPKPGWTLVTIPDRLVPGWLAPYNKRLKAIVLGKIAAQLMQAQGPYSDVYYEAREYYDLTHPEWSKGHQNFAAKRKMVKLFLAHYWERARQLEGLEIRRPYCEEHLGHGHVSKPEEYGWPEL